MTKKIKGYKLFDPDFTCRGYQFEVGKKYKHEGNIKLCESGFHFCRELRDCYEYYPKSPTTKIAEIEALGKIIHGDDGKSVTDHIKIIRELTWEDALRLTNTGAGNTSLCNSGNCNSGNWNSGDWNSGNRNSGNWNSGDRNSGNRNSGNYNSGNRNSGNYNSGDRNSGNCNSGNWNSGDWNSGNRNSGNYNSGDWNSGNWNSGNWNSGNRNSGVFCQDKNPTIKFFDQPSDWTYENWFWSDARDILARVPFYTTIWICESDMTEDEKTAHPESHVLGGYLKRHENRGVYHWQEWWDGLNDRERDIIKALPNWTAKAWKEITGIEVTE